MNLQGTLILLALFCASPSHSWGGGKKVLLRDVNVLTLYPGKMTEGRRSSPVPQLQCTNKGSAPCSVFQPRVVQCYNRGSDGYDVQWECKADMPSAYRFGDIDVSCEGYDYPHDDYILAGSCGLSYSLDYTDEGQHNSDNYYGWNTGSNYGSNYHKRSFFSGIADLIVYAGVGLMCYAFYKTCISPSRNLGDTSYSSTDGDYPSGGQGGGGYGWFGGNNGGHGGAYPSAPRYEDDASCRRNRNNGSGSGAGGFWTGAAAGGLLGYMFGNRGNQGYGYGGYNRGWFDTRRRGYGGGGGGGFSGFGGSGSRSSSGFGGTSRR